MDIYMGLKSVVAAEDIVCLCMHFRFTYQEQKKLSTHSLFKHNFSGRSKNYQAENTPSAPARQCRSIGFNLVKRSAAVYTFNEMLMNDNDKLMRYLSTKNK